MERTIPQTGRGEVDGRRAVVVTATRTTVHVNATPRTAIAEMDARIQDWTEWLTALRRQDDRRP